MFLHQLFGELEGTDHW